jgi:hypothetical protein
LSDRSGGCCPRNFILDRHGRPALLSKTFELGHLNRSFSQHSRILDRLVEIRLSYAVQDERAPRQADVTRELVRNQAFLASSGHGIVRSQWRMLSKKLYFGQACSLSSEGSYLDKRQMKLAMDADGVVDIRAWQER